MATKADKTTAIPPPPAQKSGGTPTLAESQVAERSVLAVRLRRAIGELAACTPTQVAAILSGFYNHINGNGDVTAFPQTLRRHPSSEERFITNGSRSALIVQHVGNACKGMYDLKAAKTGNQEFAKLLERVSNRIALLEQLGDHPIQDFAIDGNYVIGYALVRGKVK